MEWQAGFACGAYLMPATQLEQLMLTEFAEWKASHSRLLASSAEASRLIEAVVQRFQVSWDAARVRLLQQGMITTRPGAFSLTRICIFSRPVVR